MIDQLFPSLLRFYERLVLFFDALLISTDGAKYLISALVIVFFVSLILVPLRGRGIDVSSFTDYKISNISKRAESQKQKQEMKLAVAVRNHGDKKVQVELDKVLQDHHNGEVEVLYLDLMEIKTIKLR